MTLRRGIVGGTRALLGTAAIASMIYGAVALACTLSFARRRPRAPGRSPFASILKPLHGDEALLEENLASFCTQDYPEYEVVFGARDPADPALAVARRVAAAHPERRTLVVDGASAPRHANPKANTLAGIVPHARGELLIVVDSDMRVDPGWLRAVVAAFDDERVGAATCLYRGLPANARVTSCLGAMDNHERFAPSVLVAETLGPLRYTFGATMAVRRRLFEAIGGLHALGTHLADDARLGELVDRRGRLVALVPSIVAHVVDEPSPRALWEHELRWGRTHRALRPLAYLGLPLTYPLALALANLGLAPRSRTARALAGCAAGLRVAQSFASARAFRVEMSPALALIPLRELFGLAVWGAAFGVRRVRWRGETLRVAPDGTLGG